MNKTTPTLFVEYENKTLVDTEIETLKLPDYLV